MAHATEFGDAPHDHDGVSCSIILQSEDAGDILPVSVKIFEPFVTSLETGYYADSYSVYEKSRARAPPPRGPPTNLI